MPTHSGKWFASEDSVGPAQWTVRVLGVTNWWQTAQGSNCGHHVTALCDRRHACSVLVIMLGLLCLRHTRSDELNFFITCCRLCLFYLL